MEFLDKVMAKKKPKDPMSWETWRHAALVAVLAWAGVGADSLSSANYGPEEAYKALHLSGHEPLVLWLAAITALTDDPARRAELGQAAQDRASQRWRKDPIIDRALAEITQDGRRSVLGPR